MENTRFKISQYACAVLLIVSSIALVAYQVVSIEDVAAGLLYYVAQSFLLAGSILLSKHFQLDEFINVGKYPDNKPTMQHVANMTYGCLMLLEPAREIAGPILINSGFRNPRVNALVGGVRNSQHLLGQAADIRPRDPAQFQRLVDFLKANAYTDQLLTGNGWLHISWNPFGIPRHYVRIGYYK